MPDQTPSTATVTPSQAASAAAAQVVDDRIKEQEKRVADSLDIVDPGRPRQGPSPEQIQLQQGQAQTGAKLPAGATADAGYTPELLARASAAQIPEAEARQYQPAHLERLIQRFEQTQYDQGFDEPEPEPQQPFAFDPYTGQPLQPQFQQQQFDLPPLDPGKYEEDLVNTWEQARQVLYQQQQELAEMRAMMQQTHQTVQQQQAQAAARESQQQYRSLEAAIQKDDAYADVLGKGPAHLIKGTPQFYNRVAVANLMDDIAAGYMRRGQTPPDIETLYNEAKQAKFGYRVAHTQEQQQQRVTQERLRDRSGQFIARPTATTRADGWEAMPPGEDRAVGAVAQAIRNQRNGNANN